MADVNARIGIDVDATQALAQIKQLQRQISLFHTNMTKGGAAAAAEAQNLQRNLVNSINATGQFSASMTRISTTAESFTNALEKNKLSLGQYFRYAGASTKTFGRLFKTEFSTIEKVARERVKSLQTQYIKMGRDANGAMQAIKVRPLTLDLKNLGTQTALAAQKQQLFNQLIKQGSTNLLNWGKNTQWAGRQLMVGFTIPLTIFGATAAREFMKLEEQAIRFKRVYGDMFTAEAEVEQAIKNIKELASEFTKYGIAVEKTVDLAASVAQMGATGQDLNNQVREATRLAVLGGIEQQEALDTTISLTNAFGLATEQLTGKIAFLNAAENQTILSIEDFNEAVPKAGSVVKQLGGDVEDLAYFLTAMREGGINASQSANALKSSLARLINPTDVAREKLGEFGIDILGIVNSNAGNLRQMIQVLALELDKLDPLDKARAIEQLFGKFQFARMQTLFENIVKDGSQANKILELTTYSSRELAVIADRELARVEDSPLFKFRKTLEDFQAALAPVGEAFLKLATPLLEFGVKVLEKFNEMGDGAKTFVVGLTATLGVVAPAVLMLVGLLANGIANLLLFGTKVSGVFSKTSGSSNLLTEQLNYMNSEQMESAAVASSLDQVHQSLIQTFNAEAGAVSNLTGAYQRALTAQQQFLASQGTAGAAGATGAAARSRGATSRYNPFMPPGYADGILTVPGIGNKDTELSLLTPGEAVIPAEQAKKYRGIIASIIADNVPGYNGGKTGLPVSRPFKGRTNLMHQQSGTRLPLDIASQISGPIGEAAQGLTLLGQSSQSAAVKLEMETKEFDLKSLWGMAGDEGLNQQSQQGAVLSDLQKDMDSRTSAEIWSEGVQGGGVNPAEALDDMEEYNQEYRNQIDTARNNGVQYFTDTEENLEKARLRLKDQFDPTQWTSQERLDQQTADAVSARNKRNKVLPARAKARQSYREARSYTISREAWEEGMASSDPRIKEPIRKKYTHSSGARPRTANYSLSKAAKEDIAQLQKSGRVNGEAYNDGLEATVEDAKDVASRKAGRNSPHPEAYQDGVDDAKAYKRGQKSVISGKSDPYKKSPLAPPTPPPVVPASAQPKQGLAMRMGERLANTSIGMRFAKRFAADQGNDLVDKSGKVIFEAAKEQKQAAQETKRAAKELNQGAQELEQGSQMLEAAAQQDMAEGGGGVVAAGGRGRRGKQPKPRTGGGMGGAMGLSMGLSALTMGASMAPGALGQQAQKLMPALMGLSMAPMLFQALQSKLMAVLAVVAALAGSIIMLRQKFKGAANDALELNEALGSSSDAMKKLAEFSGGITGGEFMDKVRSERMTGLTVAPGKTTFGESFVDNEIGQQLIEASKARIAQTGGTDAVINDLTNQLSSAVISGAMTKEQAASVAANMGLALNDMEIGFKVRANIVEMIGPNGEDITGGDIVEFASKAGQQQVSQIQDQVSMMDANLEGRFGKTIGQQVLGSSIGVGVGALAGAGVMVGAAKIGAKLGGVIGSAMAPGIGTAIGVGVGALAGGVVGFLSMRESAEAAGKAAGAMAGSLINATQQQQEMADTLDAYYIKKIEEAKAQGDVTKQLELQAEYEGKKLDLAEAQAETRAQLRSVLEGSENLGNIDEALDLAIEKRFKDDPIGGLISGSLEPALDKLQGKTGLFGTKFFGGPELISEEEARIIKLELAAGMDPSALNNLLAFVGEDQQQVDALINVMGNFGGTFATELSQVVGMVEDDQVAADIFLNVSGSENLVEAEESLGLFREIATQGAVYDVTPILEQIIGDDDARARLQSIYDELETINFETVEVDQLYQVNPKLANADTFNEEYFAQLPTEDKLQYVQTISAIMSVDPEVLLAKDNDFNAWLIENGLENAAEDGKPPSLPTLQRRYAEATGQKVTSTLSSVDTTTEPSEPLGGGGGGGKETSFLDGLSKKLRDVRLNQLQIAEGFDAQANQLEELFGSGSGISVFSGLEQDMRSLGAGEDLIELIAGMPPEEFEKRKNDLFTFDGAGNITGFTARLQSIGKAMRAIALGDFQSEQQKAISTINDQVTAIRKLTAAGMSQAAAYEAVKDAAFASAVAQEKNIDVIKQLVEVTEQAKEMSEGFAAAQAVVRQNQETRDLRNALNYVQKNQGGLTDSQRRAILSDSNLQALIGSDIDPKALEEALRNAEQQADLDLRIKKMTFEGRLEIFEEGFNKAMESFSVKEKEIELDFDVKKDPFLEAIKRAEEDISDIRNRAGGLDDLQADLERISNQEDSINETYDERVEALDKIEQATKSINQLKKSQLDIADALSKGDISAAARAAQEARQKQAQEALENRRELLEVARQRELDRVTGNMGKTREEIEENIKDLKTQILEIEEQTVEPARRQVELLEREQAALVDNLDVLGKTREEWERIKNGVDLAKISSDEYIKSIQDALDVVENITDYWDDLDGRVIKTTHEIKQIVVRDFSSGGGSGGSSSSSSSGSSSSSKKYGISGSDKAADVQAVNAYMNQKRFDDRQTRTPQYKTSTGQVVSRDQLAQAYSGSSSYNSGTLATGGMVAKYAMGGLASKAYTGPPLQMALGGPVVKYGMGGNVKGYPMGGLIPYKNNGGFFKPLGSDTVPAMLTPGEFVIRRPAVRNFGVDNLEKINNFSTDTMGSVYNYNLSVNVKSESNPNEIARTVMSQIKRVDSQRIRGNRL